MSDKVVARFREAASRRPLKVDAERITQALDDHASLPDLERHALDCAEWLMIGKDKNKVAHLVLRNWLRRVNDLRVVHNVDPVEIVLPYLVRRLAAYPPDKVANAAKALAAELGHPPNTEQVAAKL